MKPMRLRAVMREAGRNIASGTSRLALAVMISAICSIVCMGADLVQITGLVNASQRWRSSGSSIYEITLQGGIDGASCEGLNSANGVIGAAALRQSTERTYVASLPATGIPTYEASAHVARVFGASTESSGVIMATALAHTYGARAGTVLPLVGGERMRVAATFAWPVTVDDRPTAMPSSNRATTPSHTIRAWCAHGQFPATSTICCGSPWIQRRSRTPRIRMMPWTPVPATGAVADSGRRSAASIPLWERMLRNRRILITASPDMLR